MSYNSTEFRQPREAITVGLIVAHSGFPFTFATEVPTATIGSLQDAIRREYLGKTKARVEFLRRDGTSFGPAAVLDTSEPYFVVVDNKYVRNFPYATADTDVAMLIQNQRDIYNALGSLAERYFTSTIVSKQESLTRRSEELKKNLSEFRDALPELQTVLQSTEVVDGGTLWEKVSANASRLERWEANAQESLTMLERAQGAIAGAQHKVENIRRSNITADSAAANAMDTQAFFSAINERHAAVKELFKELDSPRTLQERAEATYKAAAKQFKDCEALIDANLPDRYQQALDVAERRLTLYRAALRVINTLRLETERCNDDLHALKRANVLGVAALMFPGMEVPVHLPAIPEDDVALRLSQHMPDTDVDHASELLVSLGLASEGPTEENTSSSASEAVLKSEVGELQEKLAVLTRANAVLQEKNQMMEDRIDEAAQAEEIKAKQSLVEIAQLQSDLNEASRRSADLEMENAQLKGVLQAKEVQASERPTPEVTEADFAAVKVQLAETVDENTTLMSKLDLIGKQMQELADENQALKLSREELKSSALQSSRSGGSHIASIDELVGKTLTFAVSRDHGEAKERVAGVKVRLEMSYIKNIQKLLDRAKPSGTRGSSDREMVVDLEVVQVLEYNEKSALVLASLPED